MINTVFIELTNNCCSSCKSCPQLIGLQRPSGVMDFNLFKEIIDQSWKITNTVNMSFLGEPSLHPKFIDCLEYLQKRPPGKEVVIFSNFLPVTHGIMNALLVANLKKMHISINASSQEAYKKIRNPKYCLDIDGQVHTENCFEILCDKVKRWFSGPHPPTRHEFVVADYTVGEIEPFVRTWLPLLWPQDDILVKRILTYGGIMLGDSHITNSSCKMWNDNYLVVSWDGLVSPCFLDNGMKLVIGSAVDTTLEHIQNGTMRNNIRKAAMARTIEPCVKCCDASHSIDTVVYRKGDTYTETTSKWRQQ